MPMLNVSLETLEETPSRVLTMLRAIGTSPIIRSILNAHGYNAEEQATGWTLIHATSGYVPERNPFGLDGDPEIQQSIAELDAWDNANFPRFEAALARRYPEQAEFVFADLSPAEGPASIVAVATFLDRCNALENGADRKATRKQDHAALNLLAQRGLTKDERERLGKLVKVAQRGTEQEVSAAPTALQEKSREKYEAKLRELYAWYVDWSTTARQVIKRRDYLIRMGLLKRRKKGESGGAAKGTKKDATKKDPA